MPLKKKRGFAAISRERHIEISRSGGRNLSPAKRSFSLNRELARRAGSKGGKRLRKKASPSLPS